MKKSVKTELYKIMLDRMHAEGWENIRQFTVGSRVPFSLETVRRMFSECDYKNISPPTVAVIARHLGFKTNEIKDILKDYTDDEEFWRMIGETSPLTADQEAIVGVFDAFMSAGGEATATFFSQIDLVAKMYNVDIADQMDRLKRPRKKE